MLQNGLLQASWDDFPGWGRNCPRRLAEGHFGAFSAPARKTTGRPRKTVENIKENPQENYRNTEENQKNT
jgi:hypothetical protein